VENWLQSLHQQLVERETYNYLPLYEIQQLAPQTHSLFDSLVVFENFPVDKNLSKQVSEATLQVQKLDSFEETNYGITINARLSQTFSVKLDMKGLSVSHQTALQIVGHLKRLLLNLSKSRHQLVSQIDMLSKHERNFLIHELNSNHIAFPQGQCIHQLFEAQVVKTPTATALVCEDQNSELLQISYQDLNNRANQLAHYLKVQGVKPEVLVGICIERSVEMIICLLATLKTGGAYIPIDPEYPELRMAYLIEDSGVDLILTSTEVQVSSNLIEIVNTCNSSRTELKQIRCLNVDDKSDIESYSKKNPRVNTDSSNLAYAIYTSGSSGKPKGVLLEHNGLVNMTKQLTDTLKINACSKVLQFSSFSFDAATYEWATSLTSGAELHLLTAERAKTPELLDGYVKKYKLTHALLPPVLLPLLSRESWISLHTLVVGGDKCALKHANLWTLGRQFFNAYGPTEATVISTIGKHERDQEYFHMGQPTGNYQAYILNDQLKCVPFGAVGELYIGGVGLARGYLNHPLLTSEKFIPNLFSQKSGERLYRTGDLVRYLPKGNLEFVGRIDLQVKIRGFRIEPGEIESVIIQHEKVKDAIVISLQDDRDEKCLVAYVVVESYQGDEGSDANTVVLNDELRAQVKKYLPSYMEPATIVFLDSLPLTISGKINREALPPPVFSTLQMGYVSPLGAAEKLLANLWCSVLNQKQVGRLDNFFVLGGHSLIATLLLSRIKEEFNIDLPLRVLFEEQTVKAQAVVIEGVLDKEKLDQLKSSKRLGGIQWNKEMLSGHEGVLEEGEI